MTFNDVVKKNISHNRSLYITHLFSSVISISMVYLVLSFLFNKGIYEQNLPRIIVGVFGFSVFIIAVFSLFYNIYSYIGILLARSKELGVYLLIGMSKKAIRKMIILEKLRYGLYAILGGVVTGGVFSYLFHLVMLRLLQLEKVAFEINVFPAMITILIFSTIYIISLLVVYRYIEKKEIIDFIRQIKKNQSVRIKGKSSGIVGIILIIASLLSAYYVRVIAYELDISFKIFMGSIVICLIGAYLVIGNFGQMYIAIAKKRTKYYYKNILSISQLNHKFSDYKTLVFSLTLMSGLIVFLVSFSSIGIIIQEKSIDQRYTYDMFFDKIGNDELSVEVRKLIEDHEDYIEDKETVDFITAEISVNEENFGSVYIISESEYRRITNDSVSVNEGEMSIVYNMNERGDGIPNWIVDDDTVSFNKLEADPFIIQSVGQNKFLDRHTVWGVIHDSDFDTLAEKAEVNQLIEVNFTSTQAHQLFRESLVILLKDYNKIKLDNEWKGIITNDEESSELLVFDKSIYRKSVYQENAVMLFAFIYISLLLMIMSGCILYFKVITDRQYYKSKIISLKGIGVTKKEVSKYIKHSMLPIFVLPTILGGLIGGTFLILLLYVEIRFIHEIIIITVIAAIVNILICWGYCVFSKNKIVEYVIEQ